MKKNDLIAGLKERGIHTKTHFYAEAFSRNIGLLTPAELLTLSNATIAIPGMGGVGGVHLMTMIRTGIGRFHLADFDTFEVANFNRQFGATIPNLGRSKLEAMVEQALSVNPYAEIKTFPDGVTPVNVDDFLSGVQVVLDSLDFFAFDARRLLFNRAREKGIYVVTAGPLGFSSAMLIFSPHEGMRFDDYFHIVEAMTPQERYLAFAMGLAPRPTHIQYMDLSKVDLTRKAGPSLNIACQLCSAQAGTEAVRIILNKGKIRPVPWYVQFDPFSQKYRKGKLHLGNRHPIQKAKSIIVRQLLKRNQKAFKPEIPEIPGAQFESDLIIPKTVITYILQAGVQAPSGDNVQPWKFRVADNTLSLYLDRKADHSFFNINQIASIISCGAVIENMRLAASLFGLRPEISLCPDDRDPDLMATVSLTRASCVSEPLATMIWQRQTNRKFFKKAPIAPAALDSVFHSIDEFSGVNLHLVTDRPALQRLARLIYHVDRIRTEHQPLHEHLNQMIRFTHEAAIQKRDGFPLNNLEAGLAGEAFLKITRPWFIMNMANRVGIGKMVALHSLQGILNSGGAGLLTITGMDTSAFITGGQALERMWLTLTRLGLCMQPMTAITLFWLRWLVEGEKNFLPKHRRLLTKAWETYPAIFKSVNLETQGHVMLFRFGYGARSKTGTYRKPLRSFM
ncbi:MAG: ThiF family adenylyltransferase [Desulfobacterales bacterium]|nr:ThiF family adenylyltransferase [Desulfobacterales bacterium]